MCWQTVGKITSIQFYEYPFSGSLAVTCGHTGKHGEVNKQIFAISLRTHLKKKILHSQDETKTLYCIELNSVIITFIQLIYKWQQVIFQGIYCEMILGRSKCNWEDNIKIDVKK